MKILLTLNKTYRGMPDAGHWYTYLPLKELGHEVYWYDTVNPPEKYSYDKIIEHFKPDLIFCCMTGDRAITPYEPWEHIRRETVTGRTKTFNWFCDDTWRFDKFSKIACSCFTVCSTPEISYVDKYKKIGYNNILLGTWHANSDFYPKILLLAPPIHAEMLFSILPRSHYREYLASTKRSFLEPIVEQK